jgi:hypothetical protein
LPSCGSERPCRRARGLPIDDSFQRSSVKSW